MRAWFPITLLVIGGCSQEVTTLPRPPGGYDAIRVAETVQFQLSLGVIRIPAGSILVADRLFNGRPQFCGITMTNDVPHKNCFFYDGKELIFEDRNGVDYPHSASIERTKS